MTGDDGSPEAMAAMLSGIIRTNERTAILAELTAPAAATATPEQRAWSQAVLDRLTAVW